MQWQRQAKTLTPVLSDGTNVSNTTTPKLNMELKNVNTVRKLNMADTRVEDIEFNSDSSSFDNDDFSDDSDDNHYQKIARDIFGDSDSEDNEVFEGFHIQMPENVNWTLRRTTCPAENRMICTYMTNLVKDLLYKHGGKHSPNQYSFINFY